jgi:hypothetical protein
MQTYTPNYGKARITTMKKFLASGRMDPLPLGRPGEIIQHPKPLLLPSAAKKAVHGVLKRRKKKA